MPERLSREPVKLSEKVNVQISRPISEEDERSVLEVIQPNFTEFVQLLDPVPFMDRMFENLHLTLEEYERIRILLKRHLVLYLVNIVLILLEIHTMSKEYYTSKIPFGVKHFNLKFSFLWK
jgi:hypothetical protein